MSFSSKCLIKQISKNSFTNLFLKNEAEMTSIRNNFFDTNEPYYPLRARPQLINI